MGFHVKLSFYLFWSFMTLTFIKSLTDYPSISVAQLLPRDIIGSSYLGQDATEVRLCPFLIEYIRRHIMLVCPIIYESNVDHFIKVKSERTPHCC